MFLGYYEHMGRALRIDVLKREGMFIFINLFGWNFTANDATEQTIFHGTSTHKSAVGPINYELLRQFLERKF
jgi:hypothetical protein